MRTVLVCVRSPLAAQSIASCATRLGLGTIRVATSEAEVLARLGERPAELILADTAVGRPDPVGFTQRVLARAPRAVLLLFGVADRQVAAAAVAAGARGLIRAGDHDQVTTVAKALMLIGTPRRVPAAGSGAEPRTGPGPVAGPTAGPTAGPAAGPVATGAAAADLEPAADSAREPVTEPGREPAAGGAGTAACGAGAATYGAGAAAGGAGPAAAGTGAAAGPGGGPVLLPTQRGDAVGPGGEERPWRTLLTERELQVLRGMAEGKSNAEIGRDLFVSEDTVKTHARRLFRKLRARDRAHAVAVGFRGGALA